MSMRALLLGDASLSVLVRWATELAQRGWDVHVVSLQMGGIPGVEVHALMPRLPGRLGSAMMARQIRGLVDQLLPDVLHAFGGSDYGFLGKQADISPFVISISSEDIRILHHWRPFRRRALLQTFSQADRLVTTSHASAYMVTTQFPGRKPEVIPLGVDLSRFTPGEEPEVPTIGCVLPLEPEGGHIFLISALRLIVQRNPDRPLRLLIGGEGPELGALDALSRELSMANRTSFMGFVPPEAMPRFLRDLTLVAMPVLRDLEGFDRLAMEAASCGLPVVASWVGGMGEVVLDEVTGLLVPPQDPESLADAIERLLDDPALRAEMGANARSLIRSSYDRRQNAGQMEALYHDLVEEQPRAHDYLID